MLSILHISDLHFGPHYLPEVGQALLRVAHELPVDVLVASGDFTQRARREQFQEAREYLDALPPAPMVLVPGNHDVPVYRAWERLTNPYGHYRRHISEELDQAVSVDGACFVGLNSTAPLRAITNGRVHRRQLDYCAEALADAPEGALRAVVAHHHFAPAPDYERTDVMPRARRALDRFQELGVELILGGHLHRAYIGNSLDIYPGSDREHGIIIAQSGTTTSRRGRAREREKNSFNFIQVDRDTLTVTHYVYFSALGRFAPASRHLYPRCSATHLAGA